MKKVNSIGLIGYGKFSILLEEIFHEFLPNVKIKFYSRSNAIDSLKFFDLEEVTSSEILIPCVPIAAFEEFIVKIKNKLLSDTLIMDVCSIKLHPKTVLLEHVPQDIHIICTHPNFGPESYKMNGGSTRNLNFIVDRVRCSDAWYSWLLSLLGRMELNVVEMDSEIHDKVVGVPHFVSMFEGLLVNKLELSETDFGAASTTKMFEMAKGVGEDLEIAKDMYKFNPYVKDTIHSLKDISNLLIEELKDNHE